MDNGYYLLCTPNSKEVVYVNRNDDNKITVYFNSYCSKEPYILYDDLPKDLYLQAFAITEQDVIKRKHSYDGLTSEQWTKVINNKLICDFDGDIGYLRGLVIDDYTNEFVGFMNDCSQIFEHCKIHHSQKQLNLGFKPSNLVDEDQIIVWLENDRIDCGFAQNFDFAEDNEDISKILWWQKV